jgi:hypothetical protein
MPSICSPTKRKMRRTTNPTDQKRTPVRDKTQLRSRTYAHAEADAMADEKSQLFDEGEQGGPWGTQQETLPLNCRATGRPGTSHCVWRWQLDWAALDQTLL